MSLDMDAQTVLNAAVTQGGDWAELFLEEATSLAVVMDDGQVEKVLGGVDRGAGLRLIHDLHTSYAYSNDLQVEALMPLAATLGQMAQGAPPAVAPLAKVTPTPVMAMQRAPRDVDTREKVEMVRAAEAAARAVDSRIRQVRVTYMDRLQQVRIVNTLGQDAWDLRSYVLLAVHCVAADGDLMETGYETAGGLGGLEILTAADPEKVARTAARLAVINLEADPCPGGAMPVVLHSSAGGTMIHEAVGHGLEADYVLEGMSIYAGKVGEAVASPLVSVVDDASLPGRRGSLGCDDEGVPGRRNLLIENGILRGYINDRLSAGRLGVEPSGNGRRESYRFRPVPRMTNTIILPGDDDPESIVRDTHKGLLVHRMGGGQVNTANGDFVFEVGEGYLIEGGKVCAPVRGATLTGNGPQVLKEIDRVASDLGFGLGTCGKDGQGAPVADAQPTLRIPSLVVGGVQQ